MNEIYYIGLDIYKKTIAYCVNKVDGTLVRYSEPNEKIRKYTDLKDGEIEKLRG